MVVVLFDYCMHAWINLTPLIFLILFTGHKNSDFLSSFLARCPDPRMVQRPFPWRWPSSMATGGGPATPRRHRRRPHSPATRPAACSPATRGCPSPLRPVACRSCPGILEQGARGLAARARGYGRRGAGGGSGGIPARSSGGPESSGGRPWWTSPLLAFSDH
jgi:hypothetical protein